MPEKNDTERSEPEDVEALATKPCSMPIDWHLFTGKLGEEVKDQQDFWRLRDAVKKAEFALGSGLYDTAVITRASNADLTNRADLKQ
jgi:uncharacterized protein YeaO (DUF488 family)